MKSETLNSQKTLSQSKKFQEAARQLGADENEAAFDEKLKAIFKPKNAKEPPK